MSFFNHLQQYVTNSVAGLNLSPRRLATFSRAAATSSSAGDPPAEPLSFDVAIDHSPSRTWKSHHHQTVPARTVPHLLQERSRSLKTPLPVAATGSIANSRKTGRTCSLKESLQDCTMACSQQVAARRQRKPKLVPTFALMDLPKKSLWPQFAITGSGVQDIDGCFFERFTALCWKQENRRLQTLRGDDQQNHLADEPNTLDNETLTAIPSKELEQLYVEVLYTIRHKIGAHSEQYPHHYQEDLIRYAQAAFSIDAEQHRRCQAIASEEKPPIVVLNVIVIEAEGLEAKDPNGFSDPYCMLGIQPGSSLAESHHVAACEPEIEERREERRNSLINLGQIDRLRKHHSFRLSFRRRDNSLFSSSQSSGRGSISSVSSSSSGSSSGSTKEHRDSLNPAVPAKFIRATSVKTQTLTPKWNEKFKFDIDDVSSDILHLDIWDHDDEYSVLDAVSKLNEVRGVKGLGRFFKQIAQSARSGNQDDFLGSVNIPIQDIPSTGVEKWYPLEGRSQRSTIQGRIRLRMWLSTREDFGNSEEDNWTDIKQQEQLYGIFIDYELNKAKDQLPWDGDLSATAQVILHQHAIQGDVTNLQSAAVRWIVISRKFRTRKFHYSLLHSLLARLDQHWGAEQLSRDEEEALGDSFSSFVDFALTQARQLRSCFPPVASSLSRLEYLLRCLMFLEEMKAFRRCCPFHKEIRGEIGTAVRKGALEWFSQEHNKWIGDEACDPSGYVTGLIGLVNAVIGDVTRLSQVYNDIFIRTCSVSCSTITCKAHLKTVSQNISPMLDAVTKHLNSGTENAHQLVSLVLELYVALQELQKFQETLWKDDPQSIPVTFWNSHECFRIALEQWLQMARSKAHARIRSAAQLDSLTNVDSYYKHSTSAVDATSCFYQICEFWKQLQWPDAASSYPFVYSIVEIITSSAIVYADIIFHRCQNAGYFSEDFHGPALNEEIFASLNDLEHVKASLSQVPVNLQVASIVASVDTTLTAEFPRSPVQGRSRSPSIAHPGAVTNLFSGGHSSYESNARQAFHTLFEAVHEHYESKLLRTIGCLAEKMRPELKKNLFHLAWSPDSLPAEEATTPLLDYLDQQLSLMQPCLAPAAFQRAVTALWDVCLCEVWNHAETSAGEKLCAFYERLYNGLDIILHFLHADGKGVAVETLQSSMYSKVKEKLWLHKTSTEQLMDFYYAKRLEEQQEQQSAPYGILSVRAYLHHDSLSVEVISARDVIPLDPNGLSDPFVIVELIPRRIFPGCTEQQTGVHRKTLNPVFDECFEFPVSADQCRSDCAMLLFTVMDYDVLTANDFAGEAFLALKTLPGVGGGGPQAVDTRHGLKQIDLILMQQQQKNHPILSVLETRKWDRQAQDFVRKQRERIAN